MSRYPPPPGLSVPACLDWPHWRGAREPEGIATVNSRGRRVASLLPARLAGWHVHMQRAALEGKNGTIPSSPVKDFAYVNINSTK